MDIGEASDPGIELPESSVSRMQHISQRLQACLGGIQSVSALEAHDEDRSPLRSGSWLLSSRAFSNRNACMPSESLL